MSIKKLNQSELRTAIVAFISSQSVNDPFSLADLLNHLTQS